MPMPPIISISIPDNLLDKIDECIKRYGYTGRSEFVREALREYISQKYPEELYKERIYGILIALTNHELKPSVDQKVIDTIHSFQPIIRSFYHQLLEKGWCLNIVIVETNWREIQTMIKILRKIRGVDKIWFIPITTEPKTKE
ncbi:CopG family ribbon-helix-helix protein [Desulfurococcaceae archaeon MEX13E-LK6-19]|nr:CopG family ribbon-helix-helix protein [Desulfurococcaceae archaeon MEX13E-LK6-19]